MNSMSKITAALAIALLALLWGTPGAHGQGSHGVVPDKWETIILVDNPNFVPWQEWAHTPYYRRSWKTWKEFRGLLARMNRIPNTERAFRNIGPGSLRHQGGRFYLPTIPKQAEVAQDNEAMQTLAAATGEINQTLTIVREVLKDISAIMGNLQTSSRSVEATRAKELRGALLEVQGTLTSIQTKTESSHEQERVMMTTMSQKLDGLTNTLKTKTVATAPAANNAALEKMILAVLCLTTIVLVLCGASAILAWRLKQRSLLLSRTRIRESAQEDELGRVRKELADHHQGARRLLEEVDSLTQEFKLPEEWGSNPGQRTVRLRRYRQGLLPPCADTVLGVNEIQLKNMRGHIEHCCACREKLKGNGISVPTPAVTQVA